MSAAKAAVKYSVVNQAKLLGDFNARPVNNTVHNGNRLAKTLALVSYPSNIFCPNVFVGSDYIYMNEYIFIKYEDEHMGKQNVQS